MGRGWGVGEGVGGEGEAVSREARRMSAVRDIKWVLLIIFSSVSWVFYLHVPKFVLPTFRISHFSLSLSLAISGLSSVFLVVAVV